MLSSRCDYPAVNKKESSMRQIDPLILDTETEGVNLPPGTLCDQLGEVATLLVFLRHFG